MGAESWLLSLWQELSNDPLNILRPASKLQHTLLLASAYAAGHDVNEADNRHRKRGEPKHHEPKVCPSG